MVEAIKGIYSVAYSIWNYLISIVFPMLKQDPTNAFAVEYKAINAYEGIKIVYDGIRSALLPLLFIFFLIRIIKTLLSAPWEHIYKKALQSFLRFVIIIVIVNNLWNINTKAIKIVSAFNNDLIVRVDGSGTEGQKVNEQKDVNEIMDDGGGGGTNYELTIPEEMDSLLKECDKYSFFDFGEMTLLLLVLFGGIGTLGVIVSSCFTIIRTVYTRLLKPLIMLPFSGIIVAMSAGTEKMGQSVYTFYKQLFIYCLSGAVIAISIYMMKFLLQVTIPVSTSNAAIKLMILSLQNILAPVIVTSLVKEADQLMNRFS